MKILVLAFIDFSKPYGVHTRPFYICKYLSKMGNKILVLCFQNVCYSYSLQFIKLESNILFKYLFLFIKTTYYIRRFDPHIIYSHANIFTIIAYFSKLISRSNALVISDLHGSWAIEQTASPIYSILKFVELLSLKCSNKIISASEDLRQSLIRIYKLSTRSILVVPNGVDPEIFYPIDKDKLRIFKKRLGYEDKKIIIFPAPRNFVSNVIAIQFMYKVMGELWKKCSEIILLITGGGHVIEAKPPNVIYTGLVNNLNEYLNLAEVAVAPYPKEAVCGGARNKVLEFFSCKVPIVSTREGIRGIEDALPNIHFILAEDDPLDFAEKILATIYRSQKERFEMVERAYSVIIAKYSWENQARVINKYFKSCLREHITNLKVAHTTLH